MYKRQQRSSHHSPLIPTPTLLRRPILAARTTHLPSVPMTPMSLRPTRALTNHTSQLHTTPPRPQRPNLPLKTASHYIHPVIRTLTMRALSSLSLPLLNQRQLMNPNRSLNQKNQTNQITRTASLSNPKPKTLSTSSHAAMA